MATGRLLNAEEEKVLVKKIAEMEQKTTGEICVHISKKSKTGDAMHDAKVWFHKLAIENTKDRNGVLIYVAVKDRRLAIVGDKAIHEIVGDNGWNELVQTTIAHFKKGDHLIGLLNAVDALGTWLSAHFPLRAGEEKRNQLPNEISEDE